MGKATYPESISKLAVTTTSLPFLSPSLKPHHSIPKMFHPRQNIRTSRHLPINQDITSFHKPKPRDTFLRELISRKAHSADVFDAELVPKIGEKPFPGFNPVALTMVLCKEDETDILDMLDEYALFLGTRIKFLLYRECLTGMLFLIRS